MLLAFWSPDVVQAQNTYKQLCAKLVYPSSSSELGEMAAQGLKPDFFLFFSAAYLKLYLST